MRFTGEVDRPVESCLKVPSLAPGKYLSFTPHAAARWAYTQNQTGSAEGPANIAIKLRIGGLRGVGLHQ